MTTSGFAELNKLYVSWLQRSYPEYAQQAASEARRMHQTLTIRHASFEAWAAKLTHWLEQRAHIKYSDQTPELLATTYRTFHDELSEWHTVLARLLDSTSQLEVPLTKLRALLAKGESSARSDVRTAFATLSRAQQPHSNLAEAERALATADDAWERADRAGQVRESHTAALARARAAVTQAQAAAARAEAAREAALAAAHRIIATPPLEAFLEHIALVRGILLRIEHEIELLAHALDAYAGDTDPEHYARIARQAHAALVTSLQAE